MANARAATGERNRKRQDRAARPRFERRVVSATLRHHGALGPKPRHSVGRRHGGNSFRLEIGRVEGDQIFRLDTWRETLRIGAGIDERGRLTVDAQRAALACLARFAERLRGLHPSAVRAVATNTFRVATNAATFMPRAERALGFPIDIITGHEEARLIYNGVAHVLPPSPDARLVIDIGGGSTEFIVGRALEPERLESVKLGCVGMTQRFFPDGRLTATAFTEADTTARAEIEPIADAFHREGWQAAFASSGTALALAEILEQNGLSAAGITPDGLARLRKRMIGSGHVDRLRLAALKPERAPVLAGGLAIMAAAMAELDVHRINPVGGALRLGVLYDLLGRQVRRDVRVATIDQFATRYRIDREHAVRVATMATALHARSTPAADVAAARAAHWAALLHEIGFSVSPRASTWRILGNADMPGFGERAAGPRAPGAGMPRRPRQDDGKARRCAVSRAAPGAAARRHLPPCTATDRPAASRTQGRRRSASRCRPAVQAHPLTAICWPRNATSGRARLPFSLA
jgi:exopolyphosphatase/guanosine-5'-triphosphate,3'-diphosphate pyrophosphatase